MKTQYKIGSLFLIAILGMLIGYTIAQTGNTFIISQGIYPRANLTIWKEGSIFYAKNSYGQIKYFGTNSTTIIQNTIDSLTNGGSIFLTQGVYGEDGVKIHLHDGIHIYGEGSTFTPYGKGGGLETYKIPPTQFKGIFEILGSGTDINVKVGIGIHDIGIVPDTPRNNLGEAGIYIQHGHYCIIERVSIASYNTGIIITTANEANSYSSLNQILYPVIWNCTYGIYLDAQTEGHLSEVTQIYGGGIYGNSSTQKTTIGIRFAKSDFSSIYGTMFVNCETAIKVDSGSNDGTHLTDLNFEAVTTPYDIGADVDFSVFPTMPYFENWGQAVRANNEWIAHGMLGEADVIEMTADANTNLWVVGSNATHFQVGVASGTPVIYWHTYYKP